MSFDLTDALQAFTATTADVPGEATGSEAEDFPRIAETPPVNPLESATADTVADGNNRPELQVVAEEKYLADPPSFSLELSAEEALVLSRLFDGGSPLPTDATSRQLLIRETAKFLAALVLRAVPPGREQLSAIAKIDEATLWALAGIERNP